MYLLGSFSHDKLESNGYLLFLVHDNNTVYHFQLQIAFMNTFFLDIMLFTLGLIIL